MSKQIESLTVRLLQALDKNYDVVNMDVVLSVIAALENTKITKEQLEATRLAKYINLFRRRTKSEQLAKRAKSLLKKWREMVGMQQRPGSCSDLIRNESATSSNFQENINLTESLTPIQQNLDISFTSAPRNAFSNNSTCDKIAEYHKSVEKIPVKAAPTSFSNVFGSSSASVDRNIPAFTNVNFSNGPSARRKNWNLKRNVDVSNFPDAFSIDQKPNLNYVQIADSSKLNASSEPIVIDIEDSNSGSNLMQSASFLKGAETVSDCNKLVGQIKLSKHKKTKKDKKRTRERESCQELSTPLVVIDAESSLSQHSNLRKPTTPGSKEKGSADEINRNENLMLTNISEILSLSNSSMSSVFPTSSVGATKNLFSCQQGNRPLSESDLSFAGKFSQESGTPVNAMIPTIVSNENKNEFISNNVPVDIKASNIAVSGISETFHFTRTATGFNSNDSVSNSQQSTSEIVDYNNQGNKPQVKRPESDLFLSMHCPKQSTCKGVVTDTQLSSETGTIPSQLNLNTTNPPNTQISEEKIPKKRGRKKGSKGIDSIIAKDTSLSSQMLIQSLGNGAKKVKTTKELYAEMQNRKLQSTPTTPSQFTASLGQSQTSVRRDSICSEPSLHSPRTFDASSINATLSTVATNSTPEKVSASSQRHTVMDIDSGSESLISGGQSHESVSLVSTSEKAENSKDIPSTKILVESSKKQETLKLESQLRELVATLPEVLNKDEIEIDAANDIVPCTCKIIEIPPEQVNQKAESVSATATGDNLLSLEALKTSNANVVKEAVLTINVSNIEAKNSIPIGSAAKESEIKAESKRSIFDLDFEDDDDPLQSLIAEVAATKVPEKEETQSYVAKASPIINIFDHSETCTDQELEKVQHDSLQKQLTYETQLPPAFPIYKVEEDEHCLAKERFVVQVQKITNFHIRTLHNFFIPNVNGNWNDDVLEKKDSKNDTTDCAAENFLRDASKVVPNYCLFDGDDDIKKDLRCVDFSQNYKPKSRTREEDELFYETPFLGVARCLKNLKRSHRKTRKHRQNLEHKKSITTNLRTTQTLGSIEKLENIVEDKITSSKDTFEPKKDLSRNIAKEEPLKLALDEIIITNNIEKELTKENSSSSSSELQPLLAIATNVNFNNNEIESTIEENESSRKAFANKIEDEIVNVNFNAQDEHHPLIFISDNSDKGHITNNNFNNKEKSDESSCESHSSLKQTQKSINLKLKNHRRRVIEQERNSSKSYSKRKRRRKKSSSRGKQQKIKCIKIAINGGIATERHIEIGSISDDKDEDTDSDSYNAESSETEGYDNVLENEYSENSAIEKDFEWDPPNDASNKDHEYIGDEEDFDYDDDDDELEEEDEFSGEFHEVVARDISPSSEPGNNRIVLTIKKTPSKTNSPNSYLPPISPIVPRNQVLLINSIANDAKVEEEIKRSPISQTFDDILIDENKNSNNTNQTDNSEIRNNGQTTSRISRSERTCKDFLGKYKLKPQFLKRKRRLLKRKKQECKPFRFPDEYQDKKDGGHIFKKQHQKLFFPYEIFAETVNGCKSCIFEISSCDSSCAELTEYEYDTFSENDSKNNKNKAIEIVDMNKNIDKQLYSSDGDSYEDISVDESITDNFFNEKSVVGRKKLDIENQEQYLNNEIENGDEASVSVSATETIKVLPEDNNGLLESFNKICMPLSALEVSSDSIAKIKECDELCSKDLSYRENYRKLPFLDHEATAHMKNNGAVASNESKSDKKSDFEPRLEYCTGLRAINENFNNKDSNNCSRLQQFKEWHQLLQLKSYNDELLTVLPYVVLD